MVEINKRTCAAEILCLLPSAFCLLPSAFCLLPSAFCLLPSAFCLLPTLLFLTAMPARGDSLYAAGKGRSMFADRKARAVGDVVTVVITENTEAVQDGDSSASRSLDARADGGSDSLGIFKLLPRASLKGSTQQQGAGTTHRSSKLTSSITCRVTAVTPAGQLVLKGEHALRINEDTETIKFSGIVRPDDVDPTNTVPSSSVADAQIEVVGKGPISRHVRPGILSRIFDWLF